MANPISVEVRERVAAAYRAGKGTYVEIAELFGVGEASVNRWLRLAREKESLKPKLRPGRAPKLDGEGRAVLREMVEADNDATLAELSQRLHQRTGVQLVVSAIHKALVKMGITRKKDLHATERDRDDVKLLRWLFRRERFEAFAHRLLFFDESGINLAMTRTSARAPRGERAHGDAPKNWGDNVSLAAGIGLRGLVAPLMLRESMTGAALGSGYRSRSSRSPSARPTAPRRRQRSYGRRIRMMRVLCEDGGLIRGRSGNR